MVDREDPCRNTLLIVEDEALMRSKLRTVVQQAFPRRAIFDADGGAQASLQ